MASEIKKGEMIDIVNGSTKGKNGER